MAFYIKQGDTSPALLRQMKDASGNPISGVGASAKFNMAMSTGQLVCNQKTATIFAGTLPAELGGATVTAADGWLKYTWAAGDTATAGTAVAEFQVTFADASIETFPNVGYEVVNITPEISAANFPS